MNKIKPKTYVPHERFVCDWTVKKKCLFQYGMLSSYVTDGIERKKYGMFSFKQSKWLEKGIKFDYQKQNKAKNDSEKGFHKIPNTEIYGKTMENVRIRCKKEFNRKGDGKKILKEQSKRTFF